MQTKTGAKINISTVPLTGSVIRESYASHFAWHVFAAQSAATMAELCGVRITSIDAPFGNPDNKMVNSFWGLVFVYVCPCIFAEKKLTAGEWLFIR